MPTRFDLPALSDKDYAKLVKELTASIPRYSDNWTDYNFSDPGTTLLQLLAWLGDITLYRIDTIPTELYLNFTRWLVGASGEALDQLVTQLEGEVLRDANGNILYLAGVEVYLDPERLSLARYLQGIERGVQSDVNRLRRRAMAYWNTPYRAVTTADFEQLTYQVTAGVPATSTETVIRRVVVRTQPPYIQVIPITLYPLGYSISLTPAAQPPTLMTLTATIQTGQMLYVDFSYNTLIEAVELYLNPRRLLGTPVEVSAPIYNPVTLTVRLAVLAQADPATVLNAVFTAVNDLTSPVTGGAEGKGWPYGRALNDNDVLAAIADVPGIDHSQPIHVDAETLPGFVVGTSQLGVTSILGPGYDLGLPQIWLANIIASTDTWTLQVGVHARVGIDTVLPYPGI